MNENPNLHMLALQNEILEAIATGMQFDAVAELLCRRAEGLAPTAICSILSVDIEGRLHPVAAPSLPKRYSEALEGLAIGPCVGSCGTAAHFGKPIEVVDISIDPLWAPFTGLALPLGLMACWSSPIKAREGHVVATFAFYYRTKRGPSDLERQIVQTCVHLCAIALEQRAIQKRNHQLAFYDQLTDLPNRRCFDELIGRKPRGSTSFGLILLDIDHLKFINDTMGHMAGDALIKEVAWRLRNAKLDLACRLGGDEFAIVVDPCPDHAALSVVVSALGDAMKEPFHSDGNTIVPQVTMGGVVYGIDGTDADLLRQNADFALYHAKETNRGGYVRFEPGLRTAITRRMESIREVDQALADKRVVPYYQPLVRLETGDIIGLEALARIKTADGRIVAAGDFQAALSDREVACRLTDSILPQIANDVRSWIANGIPFQHVGINLSAADFRRNDLETRLSKAFDAAKVSLKHVVLEVTETVLMGDPGNETVRAVERLREKGMLVALDDFGTGYASLTHLLSFPVDIIKIDKSFVDRMLIDRPSEVIVEALIDIARKLDKKIIGEGIECSAQHERLRELGCTFGQGFHFARPADALTTTRLLLSFAQKLPFDQRRHTGSDFPITAIA
ncbi:EAL domain-containing protein [Mesorhizobium sp. M1066]|uniref:bifunctional diguanylate cyclase/phosphodiesterase n=1 Tax=unclassified Mesorhizobium TaxID=325217 RepID=UPI00333CFAE3